MRLDSRLNLLVGMYTNSCVARAYCYALRISRTCYSSSLCSSSEDILYRERGAVRVYSRR